jgi:hypothetical protein
LLRANLIQVSADSIINAFDYSGDTFILDNVLVANLSALDFVLAIMSIDRFRD